MTGKRQCDESSGSVSRVGPVTISATTVRGLLDVFAADWTLKTIGDVFEDAGIPPAPDNMVPVESGQRRREARRYLASLDLNDERDCVRLLPVFEEVLRNLTTWDGTEIPQLKRLLERLRRDGYDRDENGKIRPRGAVVLPPLVATPDEEEVIRQHLARLERGMEGDDPAAVIGSSKELIESVCKLALTRTGEGYDEADDMPALVKATQKALALHPESLGPTEDAAKAVKKILGSLSGVAVGVIELRNDVGTGHGRATAPNLGPRHAHLAAGSATTFCRMILETLDDPAAPWQRRT